MPKRISSRPTDVNQAAFLQVERSTAEPERQNAKVRPSKLTKSDITRVMSAMGRKGGRIGGKHRAERMTAEERSSSASKAAHAKWAKRIVDGDGI